MAMIRPAPLFKVLQAAADLDPDLDPDRADLPSEISGRCADNMTLFAQDLSATSELRSDLCLAQAADGAGGRWRKRQMAQAADIDGSMNAPEFYSVLADPRGCTARQ
jgi:hypothetical protein